MNKKLIMVSYLSLLSMQLYGDGSFGGGFATGAILGTGITLAATSASRNSNRDYISPAERERDRQEAAEIREETRQKRQEDKRRKKLKNKQIEEERLLQEKRDRLMRENNNRKSLKNNSNKHEQEIRELQLQIKKLELEQLQAVQ